MKIKQVVDEVKAKGAYSKRRASAVLEHGGKVVTAGIDAAKTVAAVTASNLKATAKAQKEALGDKSLPVKARVQKLGSETGQALSGARAEIANAAKAGYLNVKEKLAHLGDVTRKEQAEENRIAKRAKKAKRTAERLAAV